MKRVKVFYEPLDVFFVENNFSILFVVQLIEHFAFYEDHFAGSIIKNMASFGKKTYTSINIFD